MSADEPEMTLEQGLARARSYVEETLAAVGEGYEVLPERALDPVECGRLLGSGTGTFNGDYGVKIVLVDQKSAQQLFEGTLGYWESEGFEISLENAERGQPIGDDSVIAVGMQDGFYGSLELFPTRRRAYLGIATPCLPRADS